MSRVGDDHQPGQLAWIEGPGHRGNRRSDYALFDDPFSTEQHHTLVSGQLALVLAVRTIELGDGAPWESWCLVLLEGRLGWVWADALAQIAGKQRGSAHAR